MSNEIAKNGALPNQETFVDEIRTIIEKARSAAVVA